jgi:hypothetical protein
MTNSELKTRFLVGYDAITSFMAPGYTDAEISGFLNQGMDLIVDELYAQGDIINLAELLSKLTTVVSICTLEDYGTKAFEPTKPAVDFRWFVNARLKLSRNEPVIVNSDWVPCELITKPLADKYTQTGFNKPIIIYPKVILDGGTFIILTDYLSTVDLVMNAFQCIFIKTPTRIDVTDSLSPELHVRLHQKIADKAIQLALKATEPQRAEAEIKLNQAI